MPQLTPAEEAKLLVDEFRPHADWNNEYGSSEVQANIKHAKQCALIAVKKIIGQLENLNKPEYTYLFHGEMGSGTTINGYELIEYYISVKSEIIKL